MDSTIPSTTEINSVYSFNVKNTKGSVLSLSQYEGRVLLIVNTASKCGFTPQYAGLEKLYQNYKEAGLTILAFPCDQFGHQEPGSNEEIQQFCQINYGVSFPVMGKIDVNGENEDPLFTYLKKEAPGILGSEAIKWNFTKFLVDRSGKVVDRFAPNVKPEELTDDIEKLLKE